VCAIMLLLLLMHIAIYTTDATLARLRYYPFICRTIQ